MKNTCSKRKATKKRYSFNGNGRHYWDNNILFSLKITGYWSESAASVIIAFMPVVAAFGEIFFLKKIPKLTALLAVALSILGVYLVIGGDLSSEGSLLGYLYMLGAAISFSIYLIITKPLFDTYSDVTVSFYQSLFGCLAFIPFLGFEKVSWSQINPEISIHFIFLAVFCSGIATYFYMFALNNLGVHLSSFYQFDSCSNLYSKLFLV